jgi:hypothetical protein
MALTFLLAMAMAEPDPLSLLLRTIDDINVNVRAGATEARAMRTEILAKIDQVTIPLGHDIAELRDRVTALETKYGSVGMLVTIAVGLGAVFGGAFTAISEWLIPHMIGK